MLRGQKVIDSKATNSIKCCNSRNGHRPFLPGSAPMYILQTAASGFAGCSFAGGAEAIVGLKE